jgi:predicted lysophospholipase L1 biosynthesis ABC-type transport system permease subunit
MPTASLVDPVLRDVRYAWRTLRRAPVAAATIVVTVGLGLGLVAAVYTIVNLLVFRVDEVRAPYELFGVERAESAIAEPATFTRTDSYILGTSFWLTLVLGALALLLTLSGLFSVLSYLVEQRTREIGVRMALGASSRSVGMLVLRQSAWPVGIGLVIGCTLTVGFSAMLLSTPAAEQIGAIVQLFDPIAYGASLVCIVAACAGAALVPALRAGSVNPLAALRQE